ncbi:hypothetical protein PM082_012357 [Marasmius tenuissimus]|nr:hypothetical protein PM082_012357 [Marasmius tenuissimus]
MNLLVGPWTCWRCRAGEAETVVFALATRLCPECFRETTVSKADLLSMSDHALGITKRGKAKRVMGLVHPVPSNVLLSGGIRYSLRDVQLVLDKLASCKNGQEQLSYVQSRRKIVVKEKMYYAKCAKRLAEYEAPLRSRRYEDGKRRILDLGYNEVDFLSVKQIFRGTNPPTEQEWRSKEAIVQGLIRHTGLRGAS